MGTLFRRPDSGRSGFPGRHLPGNPCDRESNRVHDRTQYMASRARHLTVVDHGNRLHQAGCQWSASCASGPGAVPRPEGAEYGRGLPKELSDRPSAEFGGGFDRSNLWGMCGPFICLTQFSLHCVENCPGPTTGSFFGWRSPRREPSTKLRPSTPVGRPANWSDKFTLLDRLGVLQPAHPLVCAAQLDLGKPPG